MKPAPFLAVETLAVDDHDTVRVPLIGHALCAGFPSPADDFIEGALELPRWLVPNPPASYLWRIAGRCMEGAGIFDRDLACVDRSLMPSHGRIVVAPIAGEMSCRRLEIRGGEAWLVTCDPAFPPVRVEAVGEVEIWGVLRFSIRWHVAQGRLS